MATGRESRSTDASFRHPVRGRLNAWGLDVIGDAMHRIYGRRKRRLLADLPETVVELGPGSGANFRYYRPGTRVVAIEPNLLMHPRLVREASERGIEVELHASGGESIPLSDGSAEVVVSTLVLCSVADPRAVVSEVRRILRPGGRFVFVEHVAAPPASVLRRVQGVLAGPWRWCFEGCVLCRDTATLIEGAGFTTVTLERFRVLGPWAPFAPHVSGVAVH